MVRLLRLSLPQYVSMLLGCIGMLLSPQALFSQTYSWKLVAPFPYYRAEHTLYGNNIYLVYGRIIDSLDESGGNKTEIGTTPFFLTSSDAKTWKKITPKVIYPSDKAGSPEREEEIVPQKIMFLNGAFIALACNARKEKQIYRSNDGSTWKPVGINAASMNFIRDLLIVEHDLTFSVSKDGKNWSTYGVVFKDEPERHKNVKKEFRTVAIVSDYPASVSFNGDSTRGYYTDSSYVLTDNERSIGISRDGVHWRVVERPIFKNDSHVESVVGYVYGKKRFVYVTFSEEREGVLHISQDGKKWKGITVDTVELTDKYGQYLPPTKYQQIFFLDSIFYLNRTSRHVNSHSGGLVPVTVQYVSKDGFVWKMHEDFKERWVTKVQPIEKLPGDAILEEIDSTRAYRFRLGPDGTREPVSRHFFSRIIFHNKVFIIPIKNKKTMYQSPDGYAWQVVPWDIDSTVLLETDPFYKKNQLFIKLYSNKVGFEPGTPIKATDDEEEYNYPPRTGFIVISKDRRNWDTVFIDTLISETRYSPDLKKYSDGLIIFTYDLGGWYSKDARSWKKIDIKKSKADSCRALADISAFGSDRNIYIFPNGATILSNSAGDHWFNVSNNCYDAKTVTWGNGQFVAAGKDGRIWVLEVK